MSMRNDNDAYISSRNQPFMMRHHCDGKASPSPWKAAERVAGFAEYLGYSS